PAAPAEKPTARRTAPPARPAPAKKALPAPAARGRARPARVATPVKPREDAPQEPRSDDTAVLLRRPQVETPTASARMLAEATARISARRARDMLPVRIATRRLVLRAPIRGDVPDLVKLADNRNIADQ